MRSEIEVDPRLDASDGPASGPPRSFEDDDLPTFARHKGGRHQAGQAATDDDEIGSMITMVR
jgi:hypothetical protein